MNFLAELRNVMRISKCLSIDSLNVSEDLVFASLTESLLTLMVRDAGEPLAGGVTHSDLSLRGFPRLLLKALLEFRLGL